jgi:hypothetical protein
MQPYLIAYPIVSFLIEAFYECHFIEQLTCVVSMVSNAFSFENVSDDLLHQASSIKQTNESETQKVSRLPMYPEEESKA